MLAHELGHIEKFHIAKRKDSIDKLNNLNSITNLSIIAGSLISNNNEYLVQSMIGNQVGIKNYYQSFSREQEKEADFYAVETLNKLKLSTTPLVRFLNLLEKKSKERGISDEYHKFSSHPLFKDRKNIIANNKKNNYYFDDELNKKFNFIRAKLFGFTETKKAYTSEYIEDKYLAYSYSIILSKKGELKKSLKLLNKIIVDNPDYIYLLETKADILYSNGFSKEALLFYDKALIKEKFNYYVTKRIFDIKFSYADFNDKDNIQSIFDQYKFLLKIFYNNNDLKIKFQKIAKKNNLNNWVNYFTIEEKFNNKKHEQKKLIEEMKDIKKNTQDYNLIALINKRIN